MTRAIIAVIAVISIAAVLPDEPQPAIRDGSRISRTRASDQTARADDRRPLYVAAGLVVLVAALWWSRRQRDRFDVEDPASAPGQTDPGAARGADDDAADLHAAAAGGAGDLDAAATGDAAVAGANAPAGPAAPPPLQRPDDNRRAEPDKPG